LQCQEKMDRASARLSRARSALSMAMKAGMEATRGEMFDAMATALEQIDEAEAELREGENRAARPGQLAPAGLELVQSQPKAASVLGAGLASCHKLAVGLLLAASFTPSNLYTV
jgi:hypothetical protein